MDSNYIYNVVYCYYVLELIFLENDNLFFLLVFNFFFVNILWYVDILYLWFEVYWGFDRGFFYMDMLG